MPKIPSFGRPPIALGVCAALVSLLSPARAALLVYEGFNYANNATLDTLTPNSSTIGLDTSAATGASYANAAAAGANPASGLKITTGLTFGSLATSGGAVRFTGTAASVASANIISTTSSTVIWSSYLVSLSAPSASGSDGFETRLNSNTASTSTTVYFRSAADSRGTNSDLPSVAYDGSSTTGTGSVLSANTTYFIISKFDTGATGSASLWALSLAQFNAFQATSFNESFLTGVNVTATSTDPKAGTAGWNTAGTPAYLEFVGAAGGATFDEVRYGETLLDVVPVPEPSATLLFGGAALAGITRRRR